MIDLTAYGFKVEARAPAAEDRDITEDQYADICSEAWRTVTGQKAVFEDNENPFIPAGATRLTSTTTMRPSIDFSVHADGMMLRATIRDMSSEWQDSLKCLMSVNVVKRELAVLTKQTFKKYRDTAYFADIKRMVDFVENAAT